MPGLQVVGNVTLFQKRAKDYTVAAGKEASDLRWLTH